MSRPLEPLPVDEHIPKVLELLDRHRALVVSASPGAGKTTRIPPALTGRGPVMLLQPRRVAARAAARRIAQERGWTVGREIGWQIRFERRSSDDTRLLVVTEGILTARLQHDPLLSDFVTIVFDEFHERSLHADLGLALARHTWLARPEVRIVVMSATLDTEPVRRFLRDCPVVAIPGLLHPTTIEYSADEPMASAVRTLLPKTRGQVLCFLPGRAEIDRTQRELLTGAAIGAEVLPLHGGVDGATQDRALAPAVGRRVILATNIAETSLTVPGVDTVIDSGLHKVARYDAARAIDSLVIERVSQDAADQRAGRATRLGPGYVRRLWDARLRLSPHREPDVSRLDLAGPVLYLLAWGEHPSRFAWFDPPPADRIDAALRLLARLGALSSDHHITALGQRLLRLPVHPRLARILIDAHGAPEAVALCTRLSGDPTLADALGHVVAQALETPRVGRATDEQLDRAVYAGYADRLLQRRAGQPRKALLASGHGATLDRELDTLASEYLVALEVVASGTGDTSEARVRAASRVERAWIVPTNTTVEHHFDPKTGRVRATRIVWADAIRLEQQAVPADPEIRGRLLLDAWRSAPTDAALTQWLRRAAFAGITIDVHDLAAQAVLDAETLDQLEVVSQVGFDLRQQVDRQAPLAITLPSGRTVPLYYAEDGSVAASAKLQELFGLAESPRLGVARTLVTFHLLAPNGRPVQTTRDLRSFWTNTYPEVRKELRGRYPRHPWPEDPWTAMPTHRARPRR